MARSSALQLVDVTLTRWYHCITRCVRRAFLLGEGDHNRREWLENRLEELSGIVASAASMLNLRVQPVCFARKMSLDSGGLDPQI